MEVDIGAEGVSVAGTLAVEGRVVESDPSSISIVLQDDDATITANQSTGLLTPPRSEKIRKTRLVASALDRLGFTTTIIEFPVDDGTRAGARNNHVALLGLDNVPARRLTSDVSWKLAIDAGLGAGPTDFNSIMIRRFPGARRSDAVLAWADGSEEESPIHNRVFEDAAERDACGATTLAGIAVGATFVGVLAACLAVTEAIRSLYPGPQL
ncbi:hypothetical protein [Catenulispora rubra]|uniref:hypothetical protein n=1 Tax=Catenulispora rubra TaxID=280293 RepID=UPI0018926804|nr:hypothetical protein [Catenulispora rubra]